MMLSNNKLIAFVNDEKIEFNLPVNQAKFLMNLQHEAVGRAGYYLKHEQISEFTKALRMIADYVDNLHKEENEDKGE